MFPDFKIEGKRVNLRTILASDVQDYERWNNPTLKVWQFDGPYFTRNCAVHIERARKWLAGDHRPPHKTLEIETADGRHIGWVVVHHIEHDPHMTEVGINIVEDAVWNRGLGTEALALWIDYLFRERHFTRIGFSTWSGNERMMAVGRKLGFVEEARIRRGGEIKGKFVDRIKMGILRDEWEKERARWL